MISSHTNGKKSAFDLLMNKKGAKDQLKQSSNIDDNIREFIDHEIDIILLEEENALKKGFEELKEVKSDIDLKALEENLNNVDLSAYHVKQINPKDSHELLESGSRLNLSKKLQLKYCDEVDQLKESDEYASNVLKKGLSYGHFTKVFDEGKSKCSVGKYEKITNVDNICLTSYFGNDHYWVDFFKNINKKINLKVAEVTEINETNNEEIKIRRSKRRKTEQQCATPSKAEKTKEQVNTGEEMNHKQILWTDKYQFLNEDEIIDNRFQLESLKQWLQKWKKLIKTTSAKQNDDEDLNYDSDSSCSSEASNFSSCSYRSAASSCSNASASGAKFSSNAILLSGPTGCGKTSSVYCVAKQLGFKVFEVNTSHLRCKSQIMQELIGSLSSHHVTSNKVKKGENTISKDFFSKEPKANIKNEDKEKNTLQNNTNKKQAAKPAQTNARRIDSFFKTKTPAGSSTVGNENLNIQSNENALSRKRRKSVEIASSQDELEKKPAENTKNSDMANSNNDMTTTKIDILKESLILFDDIEIVLKDDQGFWSVILYFIRNSKKPIILTSSDENILSKIDLNIDQIKFNKQSFTSSFNFLKTISLCESINIQNNDFFINLLKRNKNDLRTSILELQFYLTSLDYDNNDGKENKGCMQNKNSTTVKEMQHSSTINRKEANDELKDYTSYFDYFVKYFDINHLINTSLIEMNINSNINQKENNCFNDIVVTKTESGLDDLDFTISNSFKSSLIFIDFKQQLIDSLDSYLSTNSNLESAYLRYYLERNENSLDSSLKLKNYIDIITRFSTRSCKLLSNKTLYTDYRPYLTNICKSEERKKENSKRRVLHYLNTTNIGLNKEDYLNLANKCFPSLLLDEKIKDSNEINDYETNKDENSLNDCQIPRSNTQLLSELYIC